MGTAIGKPTWDDVQILTWGSLIEHQWWDFRFALVTGEGELQVTGVAVERGQTNLSGASSLQVQGVKVVFSPAVMTGESEMVVSVSVARRDYQGNMLRYMPDYYQPSQVIRAAFKAVTAELRRLEFDADTVRDSIFLDSVVENITRWEADLGITTNKTKPYDFRREKVRAKLRALGTTTKTMIQTVAAAFSNGDVYTTTYFLNENMTLEEHEVEVIEDNANYSFKVKFTGVKGIPENMTDLSAILEEIKPAHLAFSYDYTYNVWDFLLTKTWGDVAPLTWSEIQTFG